MVVLARALRSYVWLMGLGLLLTAQVVAASPRVVADFDGDGRQDHAVVDRRASAIRVWLSHSRRVSIIPSPIHTPHLAAGDLDGDRRAELLIAGASARLRVLTFRPRGAFDVFAARASRLSSFGVVHRARADLPDDPADAASEGTLAFMRPAELHFDPAPAYSAVVDPPQHAVGFRFATPLGPRPPPAHR